MHGLTIDKRTAVKSGALLLTLLALLAVAFLIVTRQRGATQSPNQVNRESAQQGHESAEGETLAEAESNAESRTPASIPPATRGAESPARPPGILVEVAPCGSIGYGGHEVEISIENISSVGGWALKRSARTENLASFFEGVTPGRWSVKSALGHDEVVAVAAGDFVRVELAVEGLTEHCVVAVVDPAGSAVAEATVFADGFDRGKTGEDGTIAIGCIKRGSLLSASSAEYASPAPIQFSNWRPQPVEIQLREKGASLNVELSQIAGVETIRVSVGIIHTTLMAFEEIGSDWYTSNPLLEAEMLPGSVRKFEGVPAGRWVGITASGANVATAQEAIWLREGESRTVRLDLQKGVTVHGRVIGENLLPLAQAWVGEAPLGLYGKRSVETDADGWYELHQICPGERKLEAIGPPGCSVVEVVSIKENSTSEWNPVLACGFQISGQVATTEGEPVQGVLAALLDPARPNLWLSTVRTGEKVISTSGGRCLRATSSPSCVQARG
ncbi:hypothetical protein [Engelhardtia mirabilis]|uniref:hypothetical protein n=1 Tax=Engelhardtia mirabilis TaxID=2528011 RepID=UPI00118C182D|nr:hypothetical protein Pla86_52490 [Planctomycetes bacterium Pla86]